MPASKELIKDFYLRVYRELNRNILLYWENYSVDSENGGFYGNITNNNIIDKKAPKGAIQHARFLWSYSALYRIFGNEQYLKMAQAALNFLLDFLWDKEYSGVYFTTDYKGSPLDVRKFGYAQGFAIYGLSEYYRATKDENALEKAKELFRILEKYAYDRENKGYFEAFNRDWTLADNFILGEHHLNEKKSMNNHLHILEGYTNLCRVWKDKALENKFRELIEVTITNIYDHETGHFKPFFDEKWVLKSNLYTFGHDIEGSWLLYEAAEVLEDENVLERVKEISIKMAQICLAEGMDADGSVLYESDGCRIVDYDRVWWCQAEAVVGFLNAFQLKGDENFFDAALKCWRYIEENIVDKVNGEWFWGIKSDGTPMDKEKAGLWKTTYHNVRACLEAMKRLDSLLK